MQPSRSRAVRSDPSVRLLACVAASINTWAASGARVGAAMRGADCVCQLVGGDILEQVTDRARLQYSFDKVLFFEACQGDHLDVGASLPDDRVASAPSIPA